MLNLMNRLYDMEVWIDEYYQADSFICEEEKDPDTQIEKIISTYEEEWDEKVTSERVSLVFRFLNKYNELSTESCTLNQWYNGYLWKC
jgi:hypothetical protein